MACCKARNKEQLFVLCYIASLASIYTIYYLYAIIESYESLYELFDDDNRRPTTGETVDGDGAAEITRNRSAIFLSWLKRSSLSTSGITLSRKVQLTHAIGTVALSRACA